MVAQTAGGIANDYGNRRGPFHADARLHGGLAGVQLLPIAAIGLFLAAAARVHRVAVHRNQEAEEKQASHSIQHGF